MLMERTEKDSDVNVLEGSEIDMGVNGLEYNGELTGNIPFPIRADVCYKYTTTVNAMLCYKEDLTDVKDISICSPRESKTVFNSGAPVHLENFEQNVIGTDKISMTFTVKKSGNGNIFKHGFTDGGYTCAWGIPTAAANGVTWADLPAGVSKRDLEDMVYLKITTGLGVGMTLDCPSLEGTCTDDECEGYIKLYNDQRVVRCNQIVDTNIDFEKVADIYLTYNFEQNLEKSILGKHGI